MSLSLDPPKVLLFNMHTKSILIGLLGITAFAEASAIHRPFDQIMNRRAARALNTRQFGGGQFNGAKFGQGGQGANNGQNQANQNNNGQNGGNTGNQNNNNGGNNNNQGSLTLNQNAVQTGSQSNGNPDAADGESASKT